MLEAFVFIAAKIEGPIFGSDVRYKGNLFQKVRLLIFLFDLYLDKFRIFDAIEVPHFRVHVS